VLKHAMRQLEALAREGRTEELAERMRELALEPAQAPAVVMAP
jgi:hypothetical protein